MSMDQTKSAKRSLTRRQILVGAAASGSAVLGWRAADAQAGAAGSAKPNGKICILTPEAAEGPFYFDPKLVRAAIAEGRAGAPLALTLQVVEAGTCGPLDKVRVDIWHCDGLGVYSGYARQETGSAEGETFLRGTQFTDGDGIVRFDTIYPGWYPGRTPHIHFKIILGDRDLVTGQLYFPDSVSAQVYAAHSPYRERKQERGTVNTNDFIFLEQNGAGTLADTEEAHGSYRAHLVIGINRAREDRT
jgi:protocatechuate 3,4-dioxygenase beta subunit